MYTTYISFQLNVYNDVSEYTPTQKTAFFNAMNGYLKPTSMVVDYSNTNIMVEAQMPSLRAAHVATETLTLSSMQTLLPTFYVIAISDVFMGPPLVVSAPTPPPPLPPGTYQVEVTVTFTLQGDLSSFDAEAFRLRLLQQTEAIEISLEVSAGSVVVAANLLMASMSAASAAQTYLSSSYNTLSSALGVTVQQVSFANIQQTLVASPPPPTPILSPPPPPPSPSSTPSSSSPVGAIVGGVAGVLVVGLIGWRVLRRPAAPPPTRGATNNRPKVARKV